MGDEPEETGVNDEEPVSGRDEFWSDADCDEGWGC